MMKKMLLILAVLAVAGSASAADLWEDWESGMDGWTFYGGGPNPALSNAQNTTPGGEWSLKTADNGSVNYTNAVDYSFDAAHGLAGLYWTASWNFMDTGATREYLQLQSYSGGGGSGNLQQLISLGVYNAGVDLSKYNFRVAIGGVGWGNTTVTRVANVWHAMKVELFADGTVNFWIDGSIAASTTTTAVYGVTRVRVGSGLTNGGKGAYYDDILLEQIPEPGSLLALGTGLIGLLGVILRRR